MTTIKITPEIKIEVLNSINQFNNLIQKEMSFSEDLRKVEKIKLYEAKVLELNQSLINGAL